VTYEEESLDKIIGDQLSYRYFPVLHSELASKLDYHQIGEGELDLGDGIRLKTKYLNHTLQCLGYRFEYKGKSVCTAYDTEPYRNLFAMPPDSPDFDPVTAEQGEQAAREENERLVNFFRNADVLIHDAQYTREEYETSRVGWGHSPFDYAVEAGVKAQVKQIFLFPLWSGSIRSNTPVTEIHRLPSPGRGCGFGYSYRAMDVSGKPTGAGPMAASPGR
jgi:ribonuclease BN (tRNA processing enzyme)